MNNILKQIGLFGILPIATIENEKEALNAAQALVKSGLPVIEITFRTQAAVQSIEQIAKNRPGVLLGAGTIINVEDARRAVGAGAKFIVTPGLNKKVIEYCISNSIPIIPGVLTPTDIQLVLEYGLDTVKLFPIEPVGGLGYLKAIAGPYKNIKYVPTGGINQSNLLSYLKFPNVLACGGSWMLKAGTKGSGNSQEISSLTSQALSIMLGFELRRTGKNTPADKLKIVETLEKKFNLEVKDGTVSSSGSQFETLINENIINNEHVVISTNFLDRSIAYLSSKGINIKPETKIFLNERLSSVCLDLIIGRSVIQIVEL